MTNPVGWFEIYVSDLNKAQTFYESVLNTKLEKLENPNPEMHVEMLCFEGSMETYGATGALVRMEGAPVGQNSTLIYFSCDDCATEEKRVTENGGQIKQSKFSIGPHGFISLAIDPDGNMFGLHSKI